MLAGAPWERLLSRCGDAVMLHTLLHASLFAPLPRGCLLQLSGPPAAEVTSQFPKAVKYCSSLQLTEVTSQIKTFRPIMLSADLHMISAVFVSIFHPLFVYVLKVFDTPAVHPSVCHARGRSLKVVVYGSGSSFSASQRHALAHHEMI